MNTLYLTLLFILSVHSTCLSDSELRNFGFTPESSNSTNYTGPCANVYKQYGRCVNASSLESFIGKTKSSITKSQTTQLGSMIQVLMDTANKLIDITNKVNKYGSDNGFSIPGNSTNGTQPPKNGTQPPQNGTQNGTQPARSSRLLQSLRPSLFSQAAIQAEAYLSHVAAEQQSIDPSVDLSGGHQNSDNSASFVPQAVATDGSYAFFGGNYAQMGSGTQPQNPPPSNGTNGTNGTCPPVNGTIPANCTRPNGTANGTTQDPNRQPANGNNGTGNSTQNNGQPMNGQPNNGQSNNGTGNRTNNGTGNKTNNGTNGSQSNPPQKRPEFNTTNFNYTVIGNQTKVIPKNNVKIDQNLINQLNQINDIIKQSSKFLNLTQNKDNRSKMYESQFKLMSGTVCLLTSGYGSSIVVRASNGTITGIQINKNNTDAAVSSSAAIVQSVCQFRRLQNALNTAMGKGNQGQGQGQGQGNNQTSPDSVCANPTGLEGCVNGTSNCTQDVKNSIVQGFLAPFGDKMTTSVDPNSIKSDADSLNNNLQTSNSTSQLNTASAQMWEEVVSVVPLYQTSSDSPSVSYVVTDGGPDVISVSQQSGIDTKSVEAETEVPAALQSSHIRVIIANIFAFACFFMI